MYNYVIVNDVNWGIVELQERSGRFAWYSSKNGPRRQSGYFLTALDAIAYSTRKGMSPVIVSSL